MPLATAKSIAQQIIAGQASSTVHIGGTAFLGVSIGSSGFGGTHRRRGVPVAEVTAGTAADKAGITAGQLITAVGGQTISTRPTRCTPPSPSTSPATGSASAGPTSRALKHTATVTLGEGPVG